MRNGGNAGQALDELLPDQRSIQGRAAPKQPDVGNRPELLGGQLHSAEAAVSVFRIEST